MRSSQSAYRGYGIDVFGKGNHWHYSARPIIPILPILTHNAFALDAKSEALALALARLEIDHLSRLFGLQPPSTPSKPLKSLPRKPKPEKKKPRLGSGASELG